jgi:hypothetical protein
MRNLLAQALCLVTTTSYLLAVDPVWKIKPAEQWTEEDARLVLANSPWTKQVNAVVTRRLTEDQLREAGQMGQPRTIGNVGLDPKGSGPKVSPDVFSGPGGDDRSPRSRPQALPLKLRWESALPIRLAELKSHEVEPPTLQADGYSIAVYGIPGGDFKGDPAKLGEPLKSLAVLKREGQKDVRPIAVEVFLRGSAAVVVYVFPLSAEISKKDHRIRFEAQIGRVVVAQDFELSDMEFAGKLEL